MDVENVEEVFEEGMDKILIMLKMIPHMAFDHDDVENFPRV